MKVYLLEIAWNDYEDPKWRQSYDQLNLYTEREYAQHDAMEYLWILYRDRLSYDWFTLGFYEDTLVGKVTLTETGEDVATVKIYTKQVLNKPEFKSHDHLTA